MSHLRRMTALLSTCRRHPLLLASVLLLLTVAIPGTVLHAAGAHGHGVTLPRAGVSGSAGIPADQRLMLTPAQWTKDQQGPTMAEMFPPSGVGMQHPIIVWWIVLEILGLLAFPVAFLLFSNLVDRGFIIAKTLGLLLLGYLVWIGVSLGLTTNDLGAIWFIVGILVVLSAALALVLRRDIITFFRLEWRRILVSEAVFLAGFALFIALRMWYPDLGHQFSPVSPTNLGDGRMGEKQMELAFLNAVVRSRAFPPLDPFFAHGYINYYYYGFFLVGVLCKLAHVMPATGFNLAIATFFAMLVGNLFSVVLALTRRIIPGVVAAVFVALLGNLNGAWQVIRGLMSVAPLHSSVPVFGGIVNVLGGLQQVIFARQQLPPFDFWESTRIVPPVGTPISEFPYFTFLFADLHPHLMAYPMTAAALALAVNLLLGSEGRSWRLVISVLMGGLILGAIAVTNPWDYPTYLLVVALGAAVGSYAKRRRIDRQVLFRPIAWVVSVALLSFILYLPFQRGYRTVFSTGVGLVRGVTPDSLQGLCQNNPAPCDQVVHQALVTPLHIYLEHFGLFAFLVLSYLVLLLATDAGGHPRWKRWVMRAQFAFYYRGHLPRILRIGRAVRRMRGPEEPVVDISIVLGLAIMVSGLLLFGYDLLAFLVAFMGLAGLLLVRLGKRLPEQQLFLLTLLLIPVGLSLATQIAYVKDFLAGGAAFRMNTIFKFYNQAWVLYAVLAALALYWVVMRGIRVPVAAGREPLPDRTELPALVADPLLVAVGGTENPTVQQYRGEGVSAAPLPESQRVAANHRSAANWWQPLGSFIDHHPLWSSIAVVLLAGSLTYTYAGTVARETYRTSWLPQSAVPLTLDGMAFMKVAYPGDYAGISWLNSHVRGAPVIAEAGEAYYNWRSRVSMFTGLPTIINGIHEGEQRYGDELDPTSLCSSAPNPNRCSQLAHPRSDDLKTLYNSTSVADARRVIREYDVRYIYVGFSERQLYSTTGLSKFDAMVGHGLALVFRGPRTTIYEVTKRA